MERGRVYLIPSFLAETNNASHFPPVNLDVVGKLDRFIVENLRTARRFLRKVGYTIDFDQVVFYELNKHTDPAQIATYLKDTMDGVDVGLLSEAGIPCIADPGSAIVALAHEQGIRVVPLSGPSSIFLALMASGFNGQQFVFHGYLPIDRREKEQKLREMEKQAAALGQTQIFMETPYRNNQLMAAIMRTCKESTLLCIGSMISHDAFEFIRTKPVGKWKSSLPDLNKKPTVFLLM